MPRLARHSKAMKMDFGGGMLSGEAFSDEVEVNFVFRARASV
jgi:hypothetical protein